MVEEYKKAYETIKRLEQQRNHKLNATLFIPTRGGGDYQTT